MGFQLVDLSCGKKREMIEISEEKELLECLIVQCLYVRHRSRLNYKYLSSLI